MRLDCTLMAAAEEKRESEKERERCKEKEKGDRNSSGIYQANVAKLTARQISRVRTPRESILGSPNNHAPERETAQKSRLI